MYPGTVVQVDRCFLIRKEPEEPAGEGHEDGKDLCEAAGDLLLVPELRNLPRDLRAERNGHS